MFPCLFLCLRLITPFVSFLFDAFAIGPRPLPLPSTMSSLSLDIPSISTFFLFTGHLFAYNTTWLVAGRIFIFRLYPLTACSVHCWTHRIYTLLPSFSKCRQLWPLGFPLLSLVCAGQLWPYPPLSHSSHDSSSTNLPHF